MTQYQTLEIERHPAGYVTLWLNRPTTYNAFDGAMIAELNGVLRELAHDEATRFLLLRGRGKHFSSGADLNWMRESATLDYAANLRDAHELGEMMERLYRLPMPTLAVVQGAAFGGAVGLVSCCDMAVGCEDAVFSLSEVRIGLAPAVISPYIVRAIGERAARRFTLSAERFDGQRAETLGLLAESCPTVELDACVQRWVDGLLRNGPQAMRAAKTLLLDVGEAAIGPALRQRTESTIAALRVSDEGQEGLAAFLGKRTPSWQGGGA